MRITLNLATRPFADLGPAIKRLRIAMALLALAAIGLVLGLRALDQKAEQARERERQVDGQIARVSQERQSYQELMRQPENAQLLAEAEALNRLIDEKAFSWTLAMEDLETVLPGGVQVSTLEPVKNKDGHITLHLKVIGPRDRAVDLVRNLEHSRRFLLPRIVGESAEANGGPGDRLTPVSASNRVDFDVLAEYNPAGPGERLGATKPRSGTEAGESSEEAAPRSVRAVAGPVSQPFQHRGRPPYTGGAKPSAGGPNAGGLNPGAGGPQ